MIAPFSNDNETALATVAMALVALYLPGLERRPHDPPRKSWRSVQGAILRSACGPETVTQELRRAGLWSEALALEAPGLLDSAETLIVKGLALTAACSRYPQRWLRFEFAPPAVHCVGLECVSAGTPFLSVVGSRNVPRSLLSFAAAVGVAAEELGYQVVSGGANGCDMAAVSGCTRHIELLPRGLFAHQSAITGAAFSTRPLGEPFSVAAAMERNALIYAASEHSVVIHARFKRGGTWTGATEAIRRKLSQLLVREDPTNAAHRALTYLGAIPLQTPQGLASALEASGSQMRLFGG